MPPGTRASQTSPFSSGSNPDQLDLEIVKRVRVYGEVYPDLGIKAMVIFPTRPLPETAISRVI